MYIGAASHSYACKSTTLHVMYTVGTCKFRSVTVHITMYMYKHSLLYHKVGWLVNNAILLSRKAETVVVISEMNIRSRATCKWRRESGKVTGKFQGYYSRILPHINTVVITCSQRKVTASQATFQTLNRNLGNVQPTSMIMRQWLCTCTCTYLSISAITMDVMMKRYMAWRYNGNWW